MTSQRTAPTRRHRRRVVVVAAAVATLTAAGTATAATIGRAPSPAPRTTVSATVPAAPAAAAVALSAPVLDRRAPVGPAAAYPGPLASAPAPALAAYQRAATVIDSAAKCHLDWPTLAAVARVESDHGRGPHHRHRVTAGGVSRPAIFGAVLDGRHHRGSVPDTDDGSIDHDRRWDRPVGPMGLLPQTWSNVAVDADDDGVRNPQDVDDAALGAAVVLCASGRDLSRGAALRHVLARYDTGPGFAAVVVALRRRYAEELAAPARPGGPLVVPVIAMPGPGSTTASARVRSALVHLHAAAHVHGQHTTPVHPPRPPGTTAPKDPPASTPAVPSQCTSDPAEPADVPTADQPTDAPTDVPTATDVPTDGSADPTAGPTDDPTASDEPSPTEGATDAPAAC